MRHVHRGVLVLGEDSIVRLELVLLQQLLAVSDLHIEQGVAHAEQDRRRHFAGV